MLNSFAYMIAEVASSFARIFLIFPAQAGLTPHAASRWIRHWLESPVR